MKKIAFVFSFCSLAVFMECNHSRNSNLHQNQDSILNAQRKYSLDSLRDIVLKTCADSLQKIEDSLKATQNKSGNSEWEGDILKELYFVAVKDSVFFKDTSSKEIISKMYRQTEKNGDRLLGIDSVNVEGGYMQTKMEFMAGENYRENGIQKYFVVLQGFVMYFFTHYETKQVYLTLYKVPSGWILAKEEIINMDDDVLHFDLSPVATDTILPEAPIFLRESIAWGNPQGVMEENSRSYEIRNDSLIQ